MSVRYESDELETNDKYKLEVLMLYRKEYAKPFNRVQKLGFKKVV